MDNLTHSLIGYAVGKGLVSSKAGPPGQDPRAHARLSSAILWTAIVGNNAPDLDLFLTRIAGHLGWLRPGRLSDLLQHRGFTHTFAGAPLLALLSLGVGALAARLPAREAKQSFWRLFWVGVFSVALHIGADFMNDYGVHPFWPWQNDWYYGDWIFIAEPLFWFTLIPLCVFECRRRWARVAWVAILVLLLGVLASGRFAPGLVALGAGGWLAFNLVVLTKLEKGRLRWVTAAAGLVLTVFALGRARARAEVSEILRASHEEIIELVTSPVPANPFCWRTVTLTVDPAGGYLARAGVVSLLPVSSGPFSLDPKTCYFRMQSDAPAHLGVPRLADSKSIHWQEEFRGTKKEYRELARGNCRFAALLKFARVPFWRPEGAPRIAGDLRYDPGSGQSFAGIDLEGDCPLSNGLDNPPWNQPFTLKP